MKKFFDFESIVYERQVFGLLLVMVTVPVLLVGVISGLLYFSGEKKQSALMRHFYYNNMQNHYEGIFTQLKQYYSNFVQTDDFRWLASQEEPPYSAHSYLSETQRMLEGNIYMNAMIQRYTYVDIQNGWLLGKYGMAETDELVNRGEYDTFLGEQSKTDSDIYWLYTKALDNSGNIASLSSRYMDFSGINLVIKTGNVKPGLPKRMIWVQLKQGSRGQE